MAIRNPFIVSGNIPRELYCDRVQETERLVRGVTNGNNIVLISSRRMGKTGLIRHCYETDAIREEYYTFFIDILHTTSLSELIYLLGKEVYETLEVANGGMASRFLKSLKSVNGKIGFDAITGLPTFNLELGDIDKPEYTLKEIFESIDEADKPCIIAIDEFQQITEYPEKNIEALLRSHIQKMKNCDFVFAGSERHMMEETFLSSSKPFYDSADVMYLKAIPLETYKEFVKENFAKYGRKRIEGEMVEEVYNMFEGNTYYMQRVFNEAYSQTEEAEECTKQIIDEAVDTLLSSRETTFKEMLSSIPEQQKRVLYAIAREGEAENILSSAFIGRHRLSGASSVQAAMKKLRSKNIVTEEEKRYKVTDRLLALWINRLYN